MSKTYFRSEIVEIQCRVCCKTVQCLQTSTKRSRSSVDKKALHDEVESSTKTQRISLKELEACESLDPVLEGDVIEPDQLPTERNNDESTLNTTLEKLSSIPKSTDIAVLEKLGEIQNQLTRIKHMMKSQPETVAQPAHENPPVETGKGVTRLKAIRSLNELLELGFTYESDSSELRCVICEDANNVSPEKTTDHGIFTYENDLEKDFESREFLPREFINLKKSIKRHLTYSVTHKKNVQAEEQRKAERNLLERKNEKAVVPGAEELRQVISFGQPIVKGHKEALESAALYDLPPKNVLWAWDALHKSGLVDTRLCKEKRFEWLVDDTDVCSQLFRIFNWGQNHETLVEASVPWKLHLKDLVKFSETRFANSHRQIVNLLPHERLEFFMKEVTVLGKMKKCLSDHKNCGSYVDEKAKSATIAASLQSRTHQMGRQATIAQNVDAEKQVHERLEMLFATLHSGLKDEVFDDQAITVINHTKTVLNLPEVAAKLKDPDGGYIKNAVIKGPVFVDAIRSVPVR
eukprot:gene6751-7509_t